MQELEQRIKWDKVVALRWLARLMSLILCLFSYFSIFHIILEDPFKIWALRDIAGISSLLLATVGLLIGWGWERVGGAVSMLGSIGFFIFLWMVYLSPNLSNPYTIDWFMTLSTTLLPFLTGVLFLKTGQWTANRKAG